MVDRSLLWKAWPEGYLARRGVGTIGEWLCADCNPETSRWLALGGARWEGDHDWPSGIHALFPEADKDHQSSALRYAHEQGDLLPNVDPTDHATWACLLYDLAEALFAANDAEPDFKPGGLLWRPHRRDRWILEDSSSSLGHIMIGERIDDPARALVLARAQLREEPE